jgi:PAS domain S-box-containing protein
MSWVTFLWAAVVGACAIIALPHLFIGLKNWAWENLLFALATVSVAGVAFGELTLMHSRTVEEISRAQRELHLPVFFLVVGIVGFVHFHFRTGRVWIGIAACLTRLGSLVINYTVQPSLNFREITGLRRISFLGDTVAMPEGVTSSWTRLGELSSLLILIFVLDASIALWRRADPQGRRRAALVGGSITAFILLAAGLSALIHREVIQLPYLISFPFMGVILAMGFELSYDILRAAQTARQLQVSEGALRESEVRISLAANAGNLGLWMWDIGRDEIWVSDKGRTLFGFGESEPLNLDRFLRAIHEEDRPRIETQIRGGSTGGDYEREYRIVGPDGDTRWIAGYGRLELDGKGQPVCMRGVAREITKQKLAEDSLRESEARFRTVADVAPVMIWMAGPDKLCTFFNKGWLEFTGRDLAAELGNGWMQGVHPDDLDQCRAVYGTSFDARQPFTMEYRLRGRDGSYGWVLDTGTPRFDAEGSFLGYIGSCIDITSRRQAELEHQNQSMELARVGRVALMGELAASLAHEVNNPLAAMVTNANAGQRLIASGKLEMGEFSELLADIVADGHRAREVIEGIRNMVRKTETTRAAISINAIIQDLLRIVRADALSRRVSIVAEVEDDVGLVVGNSVQLLQVLLNLALNSFEALSAVRSDTRSVIVTSGQTGEGDVLVQVRDSGPGFAADVQEKLFEPFFSTKREGTGMGLAIARSIVEAHGGRLMGENCEGGAQFTMYLPALRDQESRAA